MPAFKHTLIFSLSSARLGCYLTVKKPEKEEKGGKVLQNFIYVKSFATLLVFCNLKFPFFMHFLYALKKKNKT